MMKLSDKGAMALICREGIAEGWYKDSVGVWTIGCGHTAAAGEPSTPSPNFICTVAGAFELFRKDVRQYEMAVIKAVNGPMLQHEFDAFVSICYNIGTKAFARSTFVKRFNLGNKSGCATAIMMWNKPAEIIGRRRSECDQFQRGLPLSHPFIATVYAPGKSGKLGKPRRLDLTKELRISQPEPRNSQAEMPVIVPRLPDPAEVPLPEETRPEIILPKLETKTMDTKKWWQSKSVWGALLTLVSFSGVAGLSFDADTRTISLHLDTLLDWALTLGIPGGGLLSWYGRVFARKVIG